MSATVCPAMDTLSAWQVGLTVVIGLLPLAFLLVAGAVRRAWRAGMRLAIIVSSVCALLTVVSEVASVALWLRFREVKALLAQFTLSSYYTTCMTPDDVGHFSPPSGYYSQLLHAVAQVAPLERAALVDVVAAGVVIVAAIACALVWGRRRMPTPQTA